MSIAHIRLFLSFDRTLCHNKGSILDHSYPLVSHVQKNNFYNRSMSSRISHLHPYIVDSSLWVVCKVGNKKKCLDGSTL